VASAMDVGSPVRDGCHRMDHVIMLIDVDKGLCQLEMD